MKGGNLDSKNEKKVYEVEEIQEILGISRTKVYEYIKEVYKNQKPFMVIKIGSLYRIPKIPFDKWLEGEEL